MTATTQPLRFGIQTIPTRSWPEMRSLWQQIEELGFDSVWIPDHLMPIFQPNFPFMESWTLLAGLAASTNRIRVGVLVTSNTFRHPGLLAKEAATVDHISGGRLEFGLGTGWVDFEHEKYGIPFPSAGERVSRFAEAVELIDLLMRQETTTYNGQYYQLNDAPYRPATLQQPRPPFTLAAHSPRMIQVIAPYVDRWNSMGTPEELRDRRARLDEAITGCGRNPADVIHSLLYVPSMMKDERPWSSIEAFLDFIGRYREAGMEEFILQPTIDLQPEMFERIACEVIPGLRQSLR